MQQLIKIKIGQLISVEISNNKLIGSFYCYDPESESVIIQNDQSQLIWISGHNIQSIKPLQDTPKSNKMKLKSSLINKIELQSKEVLKNEKQNVKLSDETIQIQHKLIEFFNKHQLSPTLDKKTNNINIGTSLIIIPPYDKNCCRSSNEIVLSTILNLLNQFYSQYKLNDKELKEDTDSEDLLEID
eukprot:92351_1